VPKQKTLYYIESVNATGEYPIYYFHKENSWTRGLAKATLFESTKADDIIIILKCIHPDRHISKVDSRIFDEDEKKES